MKIFKKILLTSFLVIGFTFLSFLPKAMAMTPVLSIAGTGDGDTVQINVTGDPSSSVIFYYLKSGYGSQLGAIGTTNSNGTFSTTISSAAYGIASGTPVHVSVGGVNGTVSAESTWPTVSGTSSTGLSLNQSAVVIPVGQSSSVTANNSTNGALYISNNSNPAIANANITNNQISVVGNSNGSTVITFCTIGHTTNCPSLYVTVQNSGSQQLSFSQSSVSIASGQNSSITISGGSGFYIATNNSNPSIVTTNISGSTLNFVTNTTSGISSVTICTTDLSSCGVVSVNVGVANTSSLSFSQSNPLIYANQTSTVSIYGTANSTFYVSANTNSNVVQTNISGSTLTLNGISAGSSTVTVCSSTGNCGSLNVTVNYISSGGSISLSQSSITVLVGQTLNVVVSGGTAPYSVLNPSASIAQASVNANILSIYGANPGNSLVNVCSSAGGCTSLSVTINGANSSQVSSGCTASTTFNPITGQLCQTQLTPATSIPAGCTSYTKFSTISGVSCPNYVAPSSYIPPVQDVPVVTPPASGYEFTKALKVGSIGTEVRELQKKLTEMGFYTGSITGKYGAQTQKAVKALQKKYKLKQLGTVGPGTRVILNK